MPKKTESEDRSEFFNNNFVAKLKKEGILWWKKNRTMLKKIETEPFSLLGNVFYADKRKNLFSLVP